MIFFALEVVENSDEWPMSSVYSRLDVIFYI